MSLLAQKQISKAEYEEGLVDDIAQFYDDPYGYVMYAFPWGQEGTMLAEHDGPDVWQREQMMHIAKTLIEDPDANIRDATASGHGIGKAQPHDTPTPTPGGWRKFGDLAVGDYVFGGDGAPTQVTGVYERGVRATYRVTFDDGSSVLACEDHLWNVRGRQERRNGCSGYRTLDTKTLLDLGVKRSNGAAETRQWEIPTQGAAQYVRRAPIDPYLMGVWLGDGNARDARIASADEEVIERLRVRGVQINKHRARYMHGVLGGALKPYVGTRTEHKRIPSEFLVSTIEDRTDVLRGLMDTDGYVNPRGTCVFTTISKGLAEDVVELVRSLGGKAKLQPTVKKTGYYAEWLGEVIPCQPAYNVTVTCPFNPFYLSRKSARWRKPEHRYLVRWIDSIEYVGEQDVRCIRVAAPDHLYQTEHHLVTHNTAECAWIILWAMSTRPHLSGVVTANTTSQLNTKTWRELALWNKMAINGHWFKWSATSFRHVDHPETWMVNAVPNTEHNSEAFAGLHATYKLIIFDEASGIPNKIWEVTEGAMTDPRSIWLAFGNPTRNTGRFVDCFTTDTRWNRRQVDSRTCKMVNKEEIEEWVKAYGEDSDFVRVRVRGVFPRAGNLQFISTQDYDMAVLRELPVEVYMHMPYVIAVDVARFGTDQSVIAIRQGRKLHELRKFREFDTMQLAAETIRAIKQYRPQQVFVDGVGVGAGVVDRLRMLNYDLVEINAGAKPYDTELYYNKRIEMASRMQEWLRSADLSCLQGDREARQAFIGIEYGFADTKTAGGELIRLERKSDMRKRGLPSPDEFDAVCYTFAELLGDAANQSFEPDEEKSFEPETAA